VPEPDELELVRRAILEAVTITGCCEWHGQVLDRIRHDRYLRGLTPESIRKAFIQFVGAGGVIQQVPENRPEYNDRAYYYKAILPLPEFKHGLFVEIVLAQADPELPGVLLVNAHEQNR
jgi:hypothetical protein